MDVNDLWLEMTPLHFTTDEPDYVKTMYLTSSRLGMVMISEGMLASVFVMGGTYSADEFGCWMFAPHTSA